jgi:tetratricopeptide (TPR) repeat protein
MKQMQLTSLEGIRYYTPPDDYQLSGRDGLVNIPWHGKAPIPLLEEDLRFAEESGAPDYDMVGRGIYQALRLDPDCIAASEYASVLKEAYPHIVAELGGQIVMLDAKEVDAPYLDRKINFLKIMALLDPANGGLPLEIARTYVDKGSRLSSMQHAVSCWYAAEIFFKKALKHNPDDIHTKYEYGEALYMLGHYEKAAEIWRTLVSSLEAVEKSRVESRIAAIHAGKLPAVPPLDYLTALSVAVEQHQNGFSSEAASIIQDVLADTIFVNQFPMNEVYYLLGICYQECGQMAEAGEAFKRS